MHVLRIRPRRLALFAVAVLVLGVALWQVRAARPVLGTTAVEGPVDVTLRLVDYAFQPATVEVTPGVRVRLTLVNEGREPHELEIEGQDWEVASLRPGEQVTVVFTAPRVGVYEMACHVPGHYERGMKGSLVVRRP